MTGSDKRQANINSTAIQQMCSLTRQLLQATKDSGQMRDAAFKLHQLFCDSISFDERDESHQFHLNTAFGDALGPRWAASCLQDVVRTRKFLLGTKEAISKKLQDNPGKPVTLLYAGTGPFATLFTPLTCFFTPAEVQFVLLELNPISFQHLLNTVAIFDLQKYIVGIAEADASSYKIPENIEPDIILSETMQAALKREPQVSIAANLLAQCRPETLMIPELIKVELCLLGNLVKYHDALYPIATLMELNKVLARQIKEDPEKTSLLAQGIEVTIPLIPDTGYTQLALCTSIRVYGDLEIVFNGSGLTIPIMIAELSRFKKFPVKLRVWYEMGNEPGFRLIESDTGLRV